MRKSTVKWCLVGIGVVVVVVVAAFVFMKQRPMTSVIEPLKNPEQITGITVELDRGAEVKTELFELEEDGMARLIEQMKHVSLRYHGRYSHISYKETEEDWLVILHISGWKDSITIRGNGELYTGGKKYMGKGDSVKELYQAVLAEIE